MERLIDAEALKEQIEHDRRTIYMEGQTFRGIYKTIRNAPTVEHKGEWKWTCDDMKMLYEYTCSKCQIQLHIPKFMLWNFCPNCGADMRKEK